MPDTLTTNSPIIAAYRAATPGSATRAAQAAQLFPSGITHDARNVDPYGVFIARADGPHKWDVDGHRYIDYFGGHGALLLGHHHPVVTAAVREALDAHDVVFSAGADMFTWSLPSKIEALPPGTRLIHLDTDPWEIGKNYPAEAAILGDPKATLPELTAAIRERMTSAARGAARDRLKTASDANAAQREALKTKARSLAGQVPVQPLALLEAIGEMLPRDAVVIEEALSSAPGIRLLSGMRVCDANDPELTYRPSGTGVSAAVPVPRPHWPCPVLTAMAAGKWC